MCELQGRGGGLEGEQKGQFDCWGGGNLTELLSYFIGYKVNKLYGCIAGGIVFQVSRKSRLLFSIQ